MVNNKYFKFFEYYGIPILVFISNILFKHNLIITGAIYVCTVSLIIIYKILNKESKDIVVYIFYILVMLILLYLRYMNII